MFNPRKIGKTNKLVIIGGINVLEDINLALEVGSIFKQACIDLGFEYIFKASFDKANRSSIESFRGPGITKGLKMLDSLKSKLEVPILTDVHEPNQAEEVSRVCDVLQLPAFLARQTDLIASLAKTEKPVHIKKPQFLAPDQMGNIVKKFSYYGSEDITLCERGTMFGYNNQIMDILGLQTLKDACPGKPISVDVTHSVQCRNSFSNESGGRRDQVYNLAKAVVAVGVDALFIEAHTNPNDALCDGPSAIPSKHIYPFLKNISEIDKLLKSQIVF